MEAPSGNLCGGFPSVATTICLRHIGETSQPNPRVVCPMALTGRLPRRATLQQTRHSDDSIGVWRRARPRCAVAGRLAGIQQPDTSKWRAPHGTAADRLGRLRHSDGDGARHRRQGRRRHLASCSADHGVPAMAAHRRKGAAVPHRGESRLRRRQPVRVRARVRSPSRQHHQDSRAARFVHAVGHDLAVHRLVSRPAHGIRVRRERGRRQDGPSDLRRRQRRQRLGWRLGRGDADRLARLDGRVSHSAVAAAIRPRQESHVRIHDRSRHLSLQRATELAAVQAVEDRLRVAIRLARRPRRSRSAAPTRGDAVRRHQERGEHRAEPLYDALRGDARR